MVTRSGRVLLLDFGLASSHEDDRITRSGAHIGSLPYLAPDYVGNPGAGHERTHDVYSLGVTMYELLTLQLPFRGQSASDLQLAILRARPEPLRRLHAQASWETETVCQTAMDPDPERRYATAADFARDLANVLERRPIEAQRAGALLRARRWVQRHPAAAVALGLGPLLLVGPRPRTASSRPGTGRAWRRSTSSWRSRWTRSSASANARTTSAASRSARTATSRAPCRSSSKP